MLNDQQAVFQLYSGSTI